MLGAWVLRLPKNPSTGLRRDVKECHQTLVPKLCFCRHHASISSGTVMLDCWQTGKAAAASKFGSTSW
jgi:hypothetical protein